MTRIDLHPEHLLDRARRGLASQAELERLGAHIAICAACRFEAEFARDADAHAELPADELVASRLRRDTLAALGARASEPGRFKRSRARLIVILAAALSLVATASAAAVLAVRAQSEALEAPAAVTSAAVAKAEKRAQLAAPEPAPRASQAEVATEPPPSKQPPKALEPPPSAAQLFAAANSARRKGAVGEAVDGYRELQRSHPGSHEEIVSRVTLGRLLLDRLGDAGGALAQFNSYLANPAHRALREQALIGRALALGRLGRLVEERSAWNALLSAYPKSAYAERARERLSH